METTKSGRRHPSRTVAFHQLGMRLRGLVSGCAFLTVVGCFLIFGHPGAAQGAFFQGLGDLPGGQSNSYPNDISADGSVVVGYSYSEQGPEAFRWTVETGMIGLGDLPGGEFGSNATGVSADGSVITGAGASVESDIYREAFRWTAVTGMVALGDVPGGRYRSAGTDLSADGSVIVGRSSSDFAPTLGEAMLWSEETGMVGLGTLIGTEQHALGCVVRRRGRCRRKHVPYWLRGRTVDRGRRDDGSRGSTWRRHV